MSLSVKTLKSKNMNIKISFVAIVLNKIDIYLALRTNALAFINE